MVAQRAAHQYGVAGAGIVPRRRRGGKDRAHSCSINKYFVARAARHHLGVSGDDGHARSPGRRAHVRCYALQHVQRQAFLQNEAAAQVAGSRAQHGHVVNRAVHGQTADAAAGEEERRHGIGIGAHGQRAVQILQQGGVVQPFQQGVGEMPQKTLRHQALRGASAAARIQKKTGLHYRSEYL